MDNEFTSCCYLRSFLFVNADLTITPCCGVPDHYLVYSDNADADLDFSRVREKRRAIEDALNAGRDCECSGCVFLCRKKWPAMQFFADYIHFSFDSTCNINCSYCYVPEERKKPDNGLHGKRILNILKHFYQSEEMAPWSKVSIAVGEPLLLKGFDDIAALIAGYRQNALSVNSNMTPNPKALEPLLDANRALIITSLDSGTRATYKKIKGVDSFDRVLANIRRCAKINPAAIIMKYICLPENSNAGDRDGLLDFVCECGIRKVQIVFDFRRPPDDGLLAFMGEFKFLAVRRGLSVDMVY